MQNSKLVEMAMIICRTAMESSLFLLSFSTNTSVGIQFVYSNPMMRVMISRYRFSRMGVPATRTKAFTSELIIWFLSAIWIWKAVLFQYLRAAFLNCTRAACLTGRSLEAVSAMSIMAGQKPQLSKFVPDCLASSSI